MKTNMLKLKVYFTLGLSAFLFTFILGYEQIQALTNSENINTTRHNGITDITIKNANGTKILGSFHSVIPCWIMPDNSCDPEWGSPQFLNTLNISMSIKNANGTEITRFDNITVNCEHPVNNSELKAQCSPK
jgi:hypothetical protein